MDDFAIRVEGLGKRYLLGEREPYRLLRELFRRRPPRETLWALRDLSFTVAPGEIVGIIGANGAGKSTLLKILSRITPPSAGLAELQGRVGSLLEVGTGFHPELTGRENVFLNGAILGMSQREIRRKFDEIVAFSEVERFLDTPVKRYSSGMVTRLAFAVAAHLEPEILVVDEVLAVGDAAFQRKCLGRMGEVARQGRTVLFVSHNMGAISRLCTRVLLLRQGRLAADGAPEAVVAAHLRQEGEGEARGFAQPPDPDLPLCLLAVTLVTAASPHALPRHLPLVFEVTYQVNQPIAAAHLYASLLTADERVVLGSSDTDVLPARFAPRRPGVYTCRLTLPPRLLNEGDYRLNLSLGIPYQVNFQENHGILRFSILDHEPREGVIHHRRAGVVWLDLPWDYTGEQPWD